MIITPAILEREFAAIGRQAKRAAAAGFKRLHLDWCDGKYVPSTSWPFPEPRHDAAMLMLIRQDEGLPAWEHVDYEVDLMVEQPQNYLDDLMSAGFCAVIIHPRSLGADAVSAMATIVRQCEGRADIGLAYEYGDETNVLGILATYPGAIAWVQCMGNAKIGVQGTPFDEETFRHIRAIKATYPDMPVTLDIGVTLEIAQQAKEYGVERCIVGSSLWKSQDGSFEERG